MSEGWSYFLDFKDQMFELEDGEQTVGRSRTCDVSVSDPSVSRRHVVLKADSGRILLKDLGSSNGTFINGERIQEGGELHHGDTLGLGDADLKIRIAGTSAFETVRMPAQPLEPHGEATLFLQQASADLAQEAIEMDVEAGPGHMAPPAPEPHMAPPAPEPHMAPPAPEPHMAPPAPEHSQEVTAEASFAGLIEAPQPAQPGPPASAAEGQPVAPQPRPSRPTAPTVITDAPPAPAAPAPTPPAPAAAPAPPGPPAPAPPDPPAQPAQAQQAAPQPAAPRPTPATGIADVPPAPAPPPAPAQQAAPQPAESRTSAPSPPAPAAPTDVRGEQTAGGDLLPSLDGFDVTMGPEMLEAIKTDDNQPTETTPAYNPYSAPESQGQGAVAGFGIRLVAALVDGLWMAALLAGARFGGLGLGEYVTYGIACGIGWLIVLFGWAIWGTTPGKRAFNLYVTTDDGAQAGIGFPRALARTVGYFASLLTLGIGFLMIAFSKSKRGLHDLIAGTSVRR